MHPLGMLVLDAHPGRFSNPAQRFPASNP